MDALIEKITELLHTKSQIDVYISLMDCYDDCDIEYAFWSGFGFTFSKSELELKEVRRKQMKFRQNLIDKYKRCIISGTPATMCEACHIIPFSISTDQQKYDVNNGLLLDAGLHKLYDMHLIRINPHTSMIELHKDVLSNTEYKHLYRYNKQKLNLSKETLEYLRISKNIDNKKK
jgi:hypothetical protein